MSMTTYIIGASRPLQTQPRAGLNVCYFSVHSGVAPLPGFFWVPASRRSVKLGGIKALIEGAGWFPEFTNQVTLMPNPWIILADSAGENRLKLIIDRATGAVGGALSQAGGIESIKVSGMLLRGPLRGSGGVPGRSNLFAAP